MGGYAIVGLVIITLRGMRPLKCIVVKGKTKNYFPINPRLPLNATYILDYVQWQVNTVRNARVWDLQWALLRHFRDCQEYA